MKKFFLILFCCVFGSGALFAQLILATQFINPCGGDEHNEFIVARTGTTAVNIADICFGSYNPSTNSSGTGGTAVMNYNYWWSGRNAVHSPYPTFSDFPGESCGSGLSCFGFRYPSDPADATDINTLIAELNGIAGCNVFIPVAANDIIPANSNVIIFLGAGYRGTSALCGFNDAALNLNFSNHCDNGTPLATYYVLFGNGNGSGSNCTNTTGGYFSNSSRRISVLGTFNGGDSLQVSSYTLSSQDYDPGSGAPTGNAGVIVPNGLNGTTWINNQGCVPAPTTVLPVRFEYFTAVLQDQRGQLKWRTSLEENIRSFVIEKSLDGRQFNPLTHLSPANRSGSVYQAWDENLATGNNFYRLKVINQDGTVDYSAVVKINYRKGSVTTWVIYPNPASGAAVLHYPSLVNGTIELTVTDIAGKLISTRKHAIVPGNNRIWLPVERLSAGMYMVTLQQGTVRETTSFILQ